LFGIWPSAWRAPTGSPSDTGAGPGRALVVLSARLYRAAQQFVQAEPASRVGLTQALGAMNSLILLTLATLSSTPASDSCAGTRFSAVQSDPKIVLDQGFELNGETLREFEEHQTYEVPGKGSIPFWRANEFWLEIKAHLRDGDRVYFARYVDQEKQFERTDYLFVRGDCIVKFLPWSIT
jgi:hypothetical protein